jgi:hypothetical protein
VLVTEKPPDNIGAGLLNPALKKRVNLSLTGIRLLTADKEHRVNTPVLNKKKFKN